MRVLVIGTGQVASQIALFLTREGHALVGQLPFFQPVDVERWDFDALVVVEPETNTTTTTALQAVLERNRHVVLVTPGTGPLGAWAQSVGLPSLPYPPLEKDLNALAEDFARREKGRVDVGTEYARAALGGELLHRVRSSLALQRVAITSPKGGTGKSTVAANLAVLLSLCGIPAYLVDADANATGSLHLHLRLREVKQTLPMLLRRFQPTTDGDTVLSGVVAGGRLLEAFTPVDQVPLLHFLPGFLVIRDLADPVLQEEVRVREFFRALYEVGTRQGGVVLMDVGINPAHVVHRAALAAAETVIVVIKPEVPDLAQTRQWLMQILQTLEHREGLTREEALTFIRSRIRIVYNMTLDRAHEEARKVLERALKEDGLSLDLAPHGVLPLVSPELQRRAVNSDRIEDLFIMRYLRHRDPGLASYTQALVGLAANLVPTIPEAAVRLGLLPVPKRRRFSLFRRQ